MTCVGNGLNGHTGVTCESAHMSSVRSWNLRASHVKSSNLAYFPLDTDFAFASFFTKVWMFHRSSLMELRWKPNISLASITLWPIWIRIFVFTHSTLNMQALLLEVNNLQMYMSTKTYSYIITLFHRFR